jgi:hypothetical protein
MLGWILLMVSIVAVSILAIKTLPNAWEEAIKRQNNKK